MGEQMGITRERTIIFLLGGWIRRVNTKAQTILLRIAPIGDHIGDEIALARRSDH